MSPEYRSSLRRDDPQRIEDLIRSTGFFSAEEIGIARELANDGLAHGGASHYGFLLAEDQHGLIGYACVGRIPCTESAWDLYWIGVTPEHQGRQLGREILKRVEADIRAAGGSRIYVDTSSRPQYAPTRAFYGRCGYVEAATFPDFYAPGDGKIVYLKVLETS